MLANLKMELIVDEGEKLFFNMSSNFQGILMEIIDEEAAEKLHAENLHPYSQNLEFNKDGIFWNINTTNEDAYRDIILPVLSDEVKALEIKKHEMNVGIKEKSLKIIRRQDLAEDFYQKDSSRYFELHFSSPTAFKQDGRYVFNPDLRLIYQSLMNKYENSSKDECYYDEDLLEALVSNTFITGYNLRSTKFHLEGVKIPAFMGWIRIKIKGAQTLVNYADMLFRFGEFSGIGIKTGIGMGAFKIAEKEAGIK